MTENAAADPDQGSAALSHQHGERSAIAPSGKSSGSRTDERPASCTHPVLWPLCGCASAAEECGCGTDPIPIVQIVIDTDPDRDDLTVVHVVDPRGMHGRYVRAVVDGARKLGQRILEIKLVSRIVVVDDRGPA